jgi:hypothetical protein
MELFVTSEHRRPLSMLSRSMLDSNTTDPVPSFLVGTGLLRSCSIRYVRKQKPDREMRHTT